jgi:type I restriction enzyme S subunit
MKAAELLELYERVADAPDAVGKLRRLVLELAVRGKLVEQRQEDLRTALRSSTSDVLLEQAALARRPALSPFAVPESWFFATLGEVVEMINGRAFKPSDWRPVGLPIVRIQNLNNRTASFNYCDPDTLNPRHEINDGEFLISWSGTPGTSFGAFIWQRGKAALNQHIFRCVIREALFTKEFLRLAINSQLDVLIAQAQGGVGLQHVTKGSLEKLPLPVPPLAEQHRIVAKVDELMALCDQLEAARTEREATRDRLVAASLALLNAPHQDSFQSDARFALNVLPALSARPDQVKQLRQTILNLAVHGKLVPQALGDEPAEHIVRYIASRRLELSKQGLLPKSKPQAPQSPKAEPFPLPTGWKWALLGDLCYRVADGPHYSPQYVSEQNGVPFLSTRNIRIGGFDLSSLKFVSREDHELFCRRVKPEKGDILYTKGGTTGIAKVNDLEFEFSVWVHVAVLRIEKELLSPRYVELALNSPHCYEQSQVLTQGTSNSDLGLTRLICITVPLPPLPEQIRIVAKVDELLSLCDQLEGALLAGEGARSRLLDAMLRDALDADGTNADVAAETSDSSMTRSKRKPKSLRA